MAALGLGLGPGPLAEALARGAEEVRETYGATLLVPPGAPRRRVERGRDLARFFPEAAWARLRVIPTWQLAELAFAQAEARGEGALGSEGRLAQPPAGGWGLRDEGVFARFAAAAQRRRALDREAYRAKKPAGKRPRLAPPEAGPG